MRCIVERHKIQAQRAAETLALLSLSLETLQEPDHSTMKKEEVDSNIERMINNSHMQTSKQRFV